MEYILETSQDGKKWRMRARFKEGENSRFGVPFDGNVAIREANDFVSFYKERNRGNPGFKYCRILIDIQV